jgi:hypothetical protein
MSASLRRAGANPRPNTLGFRLRQARFRVGMQRARRVSQDEFAARVATMLDASFHQTRLSRLESNAAEPTPTEALACAVAAQVSVLWLAYGFAPPAPSEVAALLVEQRACLARLRAANLSPHARAAH